MPPKRKSAPHPASRQSSQQATLSFHGKPNKITKPASPKHAKAKKDAVLEEAIARADVKAEAEPDSEERPTAEEAIAQQAADEAAALDDPLKADKEPIKTEDVLGGRAQQSDAGALGGNGAGWADDEQVRARKITDAQIKKYWRAKEEQRLAPRLHQEDMSLYEKVLREWDMSGQYGVSNWLRSALAVLQNDADAFLAMHRYRPSQALEAREYAGPRSAG